MTSEGTTIELTAHDEAAMGLAIGLAERASALDEVPVGAVVYRTDTGEPLGRAHNEVEALGDGTAHAEMLAIRRAMSRVAGKRLTGCSIAVTLEPCPMCAAALVHARIGRLIFGAVDEKGGGVRSVYQIGQDGRMNHGFAVLGGVRSEECGELLRAFFRAKREAVRDV
ncbi:MAG: nucleoside deaminase [Planctomycetota bacterium]